MKKIRNRQDARLLKTIFSKSKIKNPLKKNLYNTDLLSEGLLDSIEILSLHFLLEKHLKIKIKNFNKQVGKYKISNILKFIKANRK